MAANIDFKEGQLEDFLVRTGISPNSLYFTREGHIYKGDLQMSPLKMYDNIYEMGFIGSADKGDDEDSSIDVYTQQLDFNFINRIIKSNVRSLINFNINNFISEKNPMYLIETSKFDVSDVGRNLVLFLSDYKHNDNITITSGIYYIDAFYSKEAIVALKLLDIHNTDSSSGNGTGIKLIDHDEA